MNWFTTFLTTLVLTSTYRRILKNDKVAHAISVSQSNQKAPTISRQFEFAPNGRCISPDIFYSSVNQGTKRTFTLHNVKGDGDCMFDAVAFAVTSSMGLCNNDSLYRSFAAETRASVAKVLGNVDGNLHIEGKRCVRAKDLLLSAAKNEHLSKDKYIDLLTRKGANGGLHGGGVELTVMSNILRRPISIYELDMENQSVDGRFDCLVSPDGASPKVGCPIKKVGTFGEDLFRDPLKSIPDSAVLSGFGTNAFTWDLHILILDINTGEKHACALLPADMI